MTRRPEPTSWDVPASPLGRNAISGVVALGVHLALLLLAAAAEPRPPVIAAARSVELNLIEVQLRELQEPSKPSRADARPPDAVAADVQPRARLASAGIGSAPVDTADHVGSENAKLSNDAASSGSAIAEAMDQLSLTEGPRRAPARGRIKQELPVPRTKADQSDAVRRAGRRSFVGRNASRLRQLGLGSTFEKEPETPVVSQDSVFGTGRRGSLRGELCDIEPGTKRLTDISRCRPIAIFYTDDPSAHIKHKWVRKGRDEWFAVNYSGRFQVGESGVYTFHLASHDGSMLWIDGELVVNNDGRHPPESRSGKVDLSAGTHRIRLMHFQGPRTVTGNDPQVTPPEPIFDGEGQVVDMTPLRVAPPTQWRAGFLKLSLSRRGREAFDYRPKF